MNQLGNASGFRAKSFICIKGNDKIMALGALEFEEMGEIINELASGVGIGFIKFSPEKYFSCVQTLLSPRLRTHR
jgi:hypothetical protein